MSFCDNMYDTNFFTNEKDDTLVDRFNVLLKDTEFFDCLVGYFYVSGFYKLQESLKNTEKIRILVGMGIDSQTFDLIEDSKKTIVSTAKLKEKLNQDLVKEMDNSENSLNVEKGAYKFIEWLKSGKLEVKAYRERKTHSKLYIMKFPEKDKDVGRVVTGSSNFTFPGLEKNLEFNVELKDSKDYLFAKNKFEELWEKSEPITKDFISTLSRKTWLREDISPYELYLKFIYEFLYDKIWNDKKKLEIGYFPEGFKFLDYQRDAVLDAKDKIKEYGGVFLSDVVGLGKTYMGALLAQQLKGTTLVIAPPTLIDEHNKGGWKHILREFEVKAIVESKGKLDKILKHHDKTEYQNVIIDESHEFRNEETQRYEYLYDICKGKNVILISATPFNNSPMDLLSQIKLFQPAHNSTLPNSKVRDLENYFKRLIRRQQEVDKQEDPELYLKVSKEISKDIRENILKYLMVRRTRSSINKYYQKDLKENNLEFPTVNTPIPECYEFTEHINEVFDETLELIANNLTYAKYRPLSIEYQKDPDIRLSNSQNMMGNFIKILLLKRLESGSYAFKKSIDNSIKIHEETINIFKQKGEFYTSKNYNWKIFDLIEEDDVDNIEDMIKKGKIKRYLKDQFTEKFLKDLENDLEILYYIRDRWSDIIEYPKRLKLIELLNSAELKNKKIIIFTEFIDTADDICNLIEEKSSINVKKYTGKSTNEDMDDVLFNFDANVKKESQKDDYQILVTTDTLSHGVNLHRSNIIINFDIPWNPTKIMQRVGRIQRLGTDFDEIFIFNFFPSEPIEESINIESLAKNKIAMFIELLGNDAPLLTNEPIKSFDLFNKLTSDALNEEEIDDELNYLYLMRDIRDNDKDLFKKIEEIPKKARVARANNNNYLITLLKTGKFKKVFKSSDEETLEIDFFDAIKLLEASPDEKGVKIDENYYKYLNSNLNAFNELLFDPINEPQVSKNEKSIINFINAALSQREDLASYDIKFLIKVKDLVSEGHITKNKSKHINNLLKENAKDAESTITILRKNIRSEDLKTTTNNNSDDEIKEIVLSEYFIE